MKILSIVATSLITLSMQAQQTFPLYPGTIPNSKESRDRETMEHRDGIDIISDISRPTLTVYHPSGGNANTTAVIVCPGGGYRINAITHEGTDIAKKLNELGITAFVLKYRIPDDSTMTNRKFGPLQDAQQAIATVRSRASEFGVNPSRIGIMGFSAGGHLASSAGTHFDKPVVPQPVSVRPDFMILVYPVISFQPGIGHMGSRDNLLGNTPSEKDIMYFSNEYHITKETSPTFLVHAEDDDVVKWENSDVFYRGLLGKGIQSSMLIIPVGGHGFGLKNATTGDAWFTNHCRVWLDSQKLLSK